MTFLSIDNIITPGLSADGADLLYPLLQKGERMTRSIDKVREDLSNNIVWLIVWGVLLLATVTVLCFAPHLIASYSLTIMVFFGATLYCLRNVIKYRLEYKEALVTLNKSTEDTQNRP